MFARAIENDRLSLAFLNELTGYVKVISLLFHLDAKVVREEVTTEFRVSMGQDI